jgi:hypothetical protein
MWRSETIKPGLVSIAALMLALAGPALAQGEAGQATKRPTVSNNRPPSSNATINLINLLVKQGVLSEEQAAALIKQADDEAYVARQAVRNATEKAEGAEKTASTAAEATSPPGTKRVTYVPEIVKKQLREEIKKEVMEKAEKENWASPGKYPEWAQRMRFYGDVRLRHESDIFPKGNAVGFFPNFNVINTGNPFDVNPETNANTYPSYNVDQNRERERLRARLGLNADLFDGFSAGFRIATGDSNAPVSFNQTLGGSGGNFSKYSIWLDRAFIRYGAWSDDLVLQGGRFDNPFFSPNDLVFHRDLGFDGLAAQVHYEVIPGVTPFAVVGGFPIYNTTFDVGAQLSSDGVNATFGKFPSHDKWLLGGQIGSNFRPQPEVDLTVGAAFYDFDNVQGRVSSRCFIVTVQDQCDTDLTRPSFAQRGNTYIPLRNIVPQFTNNVLNPQFQFFGLASAFEDVVVNGRLDLGHFDPVHVILDGEYVNNVAWNKNDIAAKLLAGFNSFPNPAQNGIVPLGPTLGCPSGATCPPVYTGGNQGWLARLTVGHRELKQLWDWNAFAGYKWLQSDAVIDAFTDSDFGLGGTNLKGYFIGANLAVGQNVWLSARWMSANQIAGAPYAVDIVQVDLNARF